MNCAQVKEQLIDFLYGELSAAARTAFEEHLRGCPGCKAEVASHQKTLAHTRSALTGPLLQEPPARVRLAIMTAAKTVARPVRQAAKQETPGFFARLWRTPWFLPAFGAASVATAVFLVRVLKNPEVVPGQRPYSVDELVVPAAEPLAQPEPAAPPAEAEQAKLDKLVETKPAIAEAASAKAHRAGIAGKRSASGSGKRLRSAARPEPFGGLGAAGTAADSKKSSSRFAEPPPPARAAPSSDRDLDDLLSETGKKNKGFATPPPARAPSTRRDTEGKHEAAEEVGAYGRPPLGAKPAAEMPARKAPAPVLAPSAATNVAKPAPAASATPPAASAGAPAPRAAPASMPVYATPPPSKASRQAPSRAKEAEAEEALEEAGGADMEAPSSYTRGAKGGPSFDEEVRKADRLFANRDWNAAAAAYRELLRRFPSHKDASRWRARMNQSLVAAEEGRKAGPSDGAKAAKAKATVESSKE